MPKLKSAGWKELTTLHRVTVETRGTVNAAFIKPLAKRVSLRHFRLLAKYRLSTLKPFLSVGKLEQLNVKALPQGLPALANAEQELRDAFAVLPGCRVVHVYDWLPWETILVYADGACIGNPGPSGLGVVVLDGNERFELSEYLGHGTNDIAELTSLLRAAERLAGRAEPIRVFTDSEYSTGVLTKGWEAKKNEELVGETRAALAQLPDVKLFYIKGHAGTLYERADELARVAVEATETSGWSSA